MNVGEVHGYYLYFFNQYAEEELNKLIELCNGAQVFVDVGANIGLFSIVLAHHYPQLTVYAFEADPKIVERLKLNISLNPFVFDRIFTVPKAVGDINGDVLFHSSFGTANEEVGRLEVSDGSISISCVTLDSHFEEIGVTPEIIKIDVEGAELNVLRGMQSLLNSNKLKCILLETRAFYLPQEEHPDFNIQIESALRSQGFALQDVCGHSLPVTTEWPARLQILAIKNSK